MLNKSVLAAMAICFMTSTAAMAADSATPGAGAGGGEKRAEKFAEIKQKILARIDQHRSCVSAAQDVEAMKACRPKGGEGGGGRMGGGMRRRGAAGGDAGGDSAQ